MRARERFRPKAVIFDMDGLMIDTERMSRVAWQRASRDCAFVMNNAIYAEFIGLSVDDSLELLRRRLGNSFPLQRFRALAEQYYSDQVTKAKDLRKPGLIELLDLLQCFGCSCAVATSTHHEVAMPLLRASGVDMRVQFIITADEVLKCKPAPDLFLAAVRRLQVSARECLVLEDSIVGMEAAFAAGIPAIMVPDLVEPAPSVATRAVCIARSLFDVSRFLQESWNPQLDN